MWKYIRSFLGWTAILVSFFILTGPCYLFGLFGMGNASLFVASLWAKIGFFGAGGRVKWKGLNNIPDGQPAVYISNHQSFTEIYAQLAWLPVPFRFVAKKELFKVPFFGPTLGAMKNIKVDRGNSVQAIKSMQAAAEQVRGGISVLVYAEGTRSRDGGLASFKKGGFHLALQARVPIIPIACVGGREILPPDKALIIPGNVYMEILPAIDTTEYSKENIDELIDKTREAIKASMIEQAKEAGLDEDFDS